jgi:bifunctional DNA-binding transcriptional regulator/antitoxin component of YhaV-PrlF toxin-antitoxin module
VPRSTITSKYQTTVPKPIRDGLRLGERDVLIWELESDGARVRPAARKFLELRGSIKVGPGSPVEDVRKARLLRGTESP